MKQSMILGVLLSGSIIGSAYYLSGEFESWKELGDLTYYLADDFSSSLAEAGLLYPSNDLDDPLLESRKIVINTSMNEQTTKEVVRKLLYLDSLNNDPIDLYISSYGGWYNSAFTIIDTFHALSSKVNTICFGGCYSSSAIVVASGTGKRLSLPNAQFSIHIYYGSYDDAPYGEPPDRVNRFLREFSSLPREWLPLENDRNYYFSNEEALKFNLIDEIVDARIPDPK